MRKIKEYINNITLTIGIIFALLFSGCSESNAPTYVEPVTYTSVPVPEVDHTEAILLCIGQSNMGNSGMGFIYEAFGQVFEINISTGYESKAKSNDYGSSFLPYLGDLLIDSGKYTKVTYINVAVGGSKIHEWTPEALEALFDRIATAIGYRHDYTHILFHQGESDKDTSSANYVNLFLQMLQGIRDLGVNAPIYVAQTSMLNGKVNFDMIETHLHLSNTYEDIFPGPYTDVITVDMRYDKSHMNREGIIKHAELWAEALLK